MRQSAGQTRVGLGYQWVWFRLVIAAFGLVPVLACLASLCNTPGLVFVRLDIGPTLAVLALGLRVGLLQRLAFHGLRANQLTRYRWCFAVFGAILYLSAPPRIEPSLRYSA